ncbi:hypothetical protein FRC08_006493 [Ceratobasidium sp. 394]|nr:hypothetical protein FRC08_006493 [Ceratobasidium sp. 394]
MRFQIVMTSLVLAAVASAQSSYTGPVPITGTNLTPPPSTGIETDTSSIETQSPRPAITTRSNSEAPTETFPSISEEPTESSSSLSSPTSISRSVTSPLPGPTSPPGISTRSATAISSGAASPTGSGSPNAGVAVQVGVAGWSVVAVMAGVVAGAVLV